MGEVAASTTTDAVKTTAAQSAKSAIQPGVQAQVNAAAEAARKAAVEAAKAAGKSTASVSALGRHAAEAAAKEAARPLGVEVSRVTAAGGAELISSSSSQVAAQGAAEGAKAAATEGAKTWGAISLDLVGPGVGGLFNAGFEVWENGWSTKAGSKFVTGAAGSAAGTALAGAACTMGGPLLMFGCAAAGSMLTTRTLDAGMDSMVFYNEDEQRMKEGINKAMHISKSTAPKAALALAMVASGEVKTQSELKHIYWRSPSEDITNVLDGGRV